MEYLVRRVEAALDAAKSDPHGGKVLLSVADVEALLLEVRGLDSRIEFRGSIGDMAQIADE